MGLDSNKLFVIIYITFLYVNHSSSATILDNKKSIRTILMIYLLKPADLVTN